MSPPDEVIEAIDRLSTAVRELTTIVATTPEAATPADLQFHTECAIAAVVALVVKEEQLGPIWAPDRSDRPILAQDLLLGADLLLRYARFLVL